MAIDTPRIRGRGANRRPKKVRLTLLLRNIMRLDITYDLFYSNNFTEIFENLVFLRQTVTLHDSLAIQRGYHFSAAQCVATP